MKHVLLTSISVLALTLTACTSHRDDMMTAQNVTQTVSKNTGTTVVPDNTVRGAHIRSTTVIVTDSPQNQSEYRSSLAGPGLLALVTSQLAQAKATHPDVRAFADAEVAEQQGIARSLRNMGTIIPLLNAEQQSIVNKLKETPRGQAFDELYMEGQIMNHKKLLMITDNYLDNARGRSNAMERQSQDLARMSLPVIKRHLNTAKDVESMVD